MMDSQKSILLFLCLLALLGEASCGGSSHQKYAGFQLEMPEDLLSLVNADSKDDIIRVSGLVYKVDPDGNLLLDKLGNPLLASAPRDSTVTIRGHYILPVSGLKKGENYRFQLQIFHRANAYVAPAISALQKNQVIDGEVPVTITTNVSGCPAPVDFLPDGSLMDGEDGQWLLLCEIDSVLAYQPYDAASPLQIPMESIVCSKDADGDGAPNLNEIDSNFDPFNGDYDGDCVKDSEDAYPDDPGEWLDTDGDGFGDNEDTDADNDGASDDTEAERGTNLVDPDTDDDGVKDGIDNCGLVVNVDQADVDGDQSGNACDNDSDNDGLSDEKEGELGTDRFNPDHDGDGWNDGREVNTEKTDPKNSNTDGDPAIDSADRFPRDKTEWEDNDNDGVGNNSDLCPDAPEPENRDADGDKQGDVCDDDDDNDGVLDVIEIEAGSNPLNADSDGDGLIDWFRNGTPGVGEDPCLLHPTGDHRDRDGDGFGAVCDLSDDLALDPSADEIDFVAIFVDGASGDDTNRGTRGAPVRTLLRALALAEADGLSVFVSGDFELTETLSLADGVALYGGFVPGFAFRDPLGDPSGISSSALGTLIEIDGKTDGVGLDGFSLEMSGGLHATGLEAKGSEITLRNSVFYLHDGGGTGLAIVLTRCTGTLSNNTIAVEDFGNRFGIACVSPGVSPISLSGNRIDVWNGPAVGNVNHVYVQDCVPGISRLRYDPLSVSPFEGLTGFTDDGGNVPDGLF